MTDKPCEPDCPRCPHCCDHGIPLVRSCGWCEDDAEALDWIVEDNERQWLCPHGIGTDKLT